MPKKTPSTVEDMNPIWTRRTLSNIISQILLKQKYLEDIVEGSLATRDNWEEPILVIPPHPQLFNFSAVEEIVPPWQGDHKWVQLIHSVGRSKERLHAQEDTVYGRGHEPHLDKEDMYPIS